MVELNVTDGSFKLLLDESEVVIYMLASCEMRKSDLVSLAETADVFDNGLSVVEIPC